MTKQKVERVCQVHAEHTPQPRVLHDHHVQPAAMGGPTVPDNLVTVCPTGHYNIHLYMAALVFSKPRPRVTVTEKRYAVLGYERWLAAGKPGNEHAAYALADHDHTHREGGVDVHLS